MPYDAEDLLDDITSILQNNLTAKLSAIDTAKADGITLDVPASGSYFFGEMPDSQNVASPWVVIGMQGPIVSRTSGPVIRQELQAFIALGHEGVMNETTENIHRIFMRYTKAIAEVLAESYNSIRRNPDLVIDQLPAPINLTDEAGEVVAITSGVLVTATIAT